MLDIAEASFSLLVFEGTSMCPASIMLSLIQFSEVNNSDSMVKDGVSRMQ
ncbi:hypothetical protein X975_15535, partial [Stegodyphus mimosarum]